MKKGFHLPNKHKKKFVFLFDTPNVGSFYSAIPKTQGHLQRDTLKELFEIRILVLSMYAQR